jgi:protocatechuate 4,5-dioxygenase beta chain
LLEEATSDQLARAGNVAGEILNWIALLGMVGKRKPAFVEKHNGHGHAFAAWRWDA